MPKPNPSPNWTSEERFVVIAWLSEKLVELSNEASPYKNSSIQNIAGRIRLVATRSSGFLETNRDNIFNEKWWLV